MPHDNTSPLYGVDLWGPRGAWEREVEREESDRTSFIDSDGNINLDNWPVAHAGQCPQCEGYGKDYIPGRLFGLRTCPKCKGSGRCN